MSARFLATALVTLMLASPAIAQSTDRDWAACEQNKDRARQIEGCTNVLARGQRESVGNRVNALFNRGVAFHANHEYGKAIADLSESIRLGPQHAETYYKRALAYVDSHDDNRALEDYATALRLNPADRNDYFDNEVAHRARGELLIRKNDPDGALDAFNAAVRAGGTGALTFFHRARLHALRGNCILANLDYDVVLRALPTDTDPAIPHKDVFSLRGNCRTQVEDFSGAIEDLDRAIALDPANYALFANRGYAWYRKNDLARALADTQIAVRLNPRDAMAVGNRGYLHFLLGDYDKADADVTTALRLDPKQIDSIITRAAIIGRKGNLVAAIAILRDSLRIAPDDREGKLHLAEFEQALAAQERAKAVAAAPAPVTTPAPAAAAPAPVILPAPVAAPAAPQTLAALPSPAKPDAPATVAIPPGRRVALVIGNGAYREKGANMPSLANAKNDAEDVAKSLTALGFEVTLGLDLGRTQMEDRLIAFSKAARGADASLIYFAGHGLQHKGVNYLAPVDAVLKEEGDLRRFIVVQSLIEDLQSAKGARILVLDACRDNEAINQLAAQLPASRSAAFGRGLAEVKADGVLVAFSTQPGRLADDGKPSDRNSPFAASLLRHIGTPGLELRTLLTRVRTEVLRQTNGGQRPETSDSMEGEFQFAPKAG